MAASKIHAPSLVLITGIPGVGKTTLMTKIHQNLAKDGVKCSGFITEEIRVGGKRIGFDVVTVDGQRGALARVSDSSDQVPMGKQREYKVGQYSVNLMSFEQTALTTLRPPSKAEAGVKSVYLVDEIGKMELFSQNFVQAVRRLLTSPNTTIVATIPVPKGRPIPFVEELRNSSATVFEITRANRDGILGDVVKTLNELLGVGTDR